MFESETYLRLFEELYKMALEKGPFDREWLNVPLVKEHALQGNSFISILKTQ